jgi:hypothetical protein
MRKSILAIAGALALCASGASAGTLMYLSFDNEASGVKTSGSEFTPAAPEVNNLGTTPTRYFYVANGATDGPEIGNAPGGLTGTRQGGKCLLLQSGGKDEGILGVMAAAVPKKSLTIESVWFTNDLAVAGNTAAIQSVIGDEWPSAARVQLFLRTVGSSIQYWTDRGDSNQECVTSSLTMATNHWYHMAMVFDLNTGTDVATLQLYIDGVLVGTNTYSPGGIYGWGGDLNAALFGGIPLTNPVTSFAIGFANGQNANLGDHRGLSGGIDALAISDSVLGPGTFVLPQGIQPSAAAHDWQLHE